MFLTRARIDQPQNLPAYVRKLPVVQTIIKRPLEFTEPITIFTGENGTGKSTVVEALAAAMGANSEGGSKHARFSTTPESHSPLSQHVVCTRRENPRDVFFVRGESFLNLANFYASMIDPLNDLPTLSHGQSLMRVFRYRLGSQGLFFLDEPEDGLSVFRQLELLGILYHLAKGGSQIIMATHSPVLLGIPGAHILSVENGLQATAFNLCEAVIAHRELIDDPHGTIRYLLGDDQ
ncbi:AAA family ATPase [Corynebacterium breve]|uniref:AAA family ATPase n=1 Tax=Corynebacterium breve TaxID=3049799 RepID=A0ABY8VD50_9CORY|nr:AAA family ATPase [Corynebacterium breve]WIM67584.1 AAA family ATPase [Corynebacterium breve]